MREKVSKSRKEGNNKKDGRRETKERKREMEGKTDKWHMCTFVVTVHDAYDFVRVDIITPRSLPLSPHTS